MDFTLVDYNNNVTHIVNSASYAQYELVGGMDLLAQWDCSRLLTLLAHWASKQMQQGWSLRLAVLSVPHHITPHTPHTPPPLFFFPPPFFNFLPPPPKKEKIKIKKKTK